MKTASNDKYNGVSEVVEFIKKTYRKNYSVDYYAALCSLQKCYFITLFKSYTGVSPQRFRTNIRIEKAKDLLENTNMKNEAIAKAIGYHNPLYFSRIFKKYTGVSPQKYRKYDDKPWFLQSRLFSY